MSNDKLTISAFQLFQMFPDEGAARKYLEGRRWPSGVCCPTCGSVERITTRGGKREGFYRRGSGCGEFTVRTGTIFERSHLSLRQWVIAMYLLVTARGVQARCGTGAHASSCCDRAARYGR